MSLGELTAWAKRFGLYDSWMNRLSASERKQELEFRYAQAEKQDQQEAQEAWQ